MLTRITSFIACVGILLTGYVHATKNNTVKAVVFDFGGVIAKSNTAETAAFLQNSFQIDTNEVRTALKSMQTAVSNGESESQFWEQYAQSRKITLPKDWIKQFDTVVRNGITEIPGTMAIVKELQTEGYKTAMLSDVTQFQATVVRSLGYYDHFNPLLLSYKIGVEKPNPEAFLILLKELKLQPPSVIFIDDKYENVEAAKQLGIDAIQFDNANQLRAELEKRSLFVTKTS